MIVAECQLCAPALIFVVENCHSQAVTKGGRCLSRSSGPAALPDLFCFRACSS